MAYISKITIPGGSTYDIKDASARQDISTLFQIINQGALDLVVVTSLQRVKFILFLIALMIRVYVIYMTSM